MNNTILQKRRRLTMIWYLARTAFIIVIITAAIVGSVRALLIQPFEVHGTSMLPGFDDHEYLLVEKLSYLFHPPRRGDVIIFQPPRNSERFYIKRVIGLPHETVEITDEHVIIHTSDIDEEDPLTLEEPYITHHVSTGRTYELGEDEYFVMGDNRPHSNDSRNWGAISRRDIIGQAWLRLRPWSKKGSFPGHYNYLYENESGELPQESVE